MAVTVSLFNHSAKRFADGSNLVTDFYKINLYSAFTFDATATTLAAAQTGATQLPNAFGYSQDFKLLTSVTVTQTGNDAAFDAADVTWTATGGQIAAAHALVYNVNDDGNPPLLYINFGETKTADDGTDFKIIWDAAGIVTFTVA
jgi:hypothetical protein